MARAFVFMFCLCSVAGASLSLVRAQEPVLARDLPLLLREDFSEGGQRFEPLDPNAWRIEQESGNAIFSQFAASKYEPPHRSPVNIALLKDLSAANFVLEAKLKSTCQDYGHRDMCLVFGYQDPANFYYVHFGKQADEHANQIFIVHNAPRTKISLTSTPGTPWDDAWHNIKVVRDVSTGTIEVYFDNLDQPAMTAKDQTFKQGRFGIGSFDDTGVWDDLVIWGTSPL